MKTSRQQLLDYIEQHRAVTAEELSRVLHMTQANVRHHLDILQEQDQVEVIGHRPSERKGRPPRFFGPSEKLLGNNLDLITSILLQEFKEISDSEFKEKLISNVTKRLLRIISSSKDQHFSDIDILNNKQLEGIEKSDVGRTNKDVSISLSQRLYQAIQDLNRFHFHARWEAHVESPRVILGHCPYQWLPNRHPELCQVDSALLSGLLHSNVEQIARLTKDRRGVTSCVFRVHSNY